MKMAALSMIFLLGFVTKAFSEVTSLETSHCMALASAAGLLGPDAERDPAAAFTRAYVSLLPHDLSRTALERLSVDPMELPIYSSAGEMINQGAQLYRLIHDYLPRLSDAHHREAIDQIKATLQAKLNTDAVDRRRADQAHQQQIAIDATLVWQGHNTDITSLSFSKRDQFLVSTAFFEPAKLWSVKTGDFVRGFQDEDHGRISTAEFSPDSSILATGSTSGKLSLWDVNTGKLLGSHDMKVPIQAVVFTHDGKQVIGTAGSVLKSWVVGPNPLSRHFLTEWASESYDGLSVSQDNSQLLTWSKADRAQVWSMTSDRTVLFSLEKTRKTLDGLRFAKDGKTIVGVADHNLYFWNSTSGLFEPGVRPYMPFADHFALSPDENLLATSYEADGKISLAHILNSTRPELILTTGAWTPHLKFSSDGSKLAIGSNDGKIRIFNLALKRDDSQDGTTKTMAYLREILK